jgi:uracil-DNA glycosylase family protein
MVAPVTPPSVAPIRRGRRASASILEEASPEILPDIVNAVAVCRRCDLWRNATQGVPGEGSSVARLMLVGEQPGDREDLTGRPFVGPAGRVLEQALVAAGLSRDEVYLTNAVKHFRHERRGKRRIHQTPNRSEVSACRWWLDAERRIVRPRAIVALGATAALAVFGRPVRIGTSRTQVFQVDDQTRAVVTYHPSFLLRLRDRKEREDAEGALIEDLKLAGSLVAKARAGGA